MASCVNLLRNLCTKTISLAKKPCTSVSFLLASACAVDGTRPSINNLEPLKLLEKKEMTHQALIKQACTLTTNSSSQLLTQVIIAINDTSQEYRKAMSELIFLLEESLLHLTNANTATLDQIEDLIVQQRNIVEEQRQLLHELVSLMDYVEKMVTSTAETAFLAGAEQSSTLMCERLNSALNKVVEEHSENKKSEEDLLKLQEAYVLKLGELYDKQWKTSDTSDNQERDGKCSNQIMPMDIFESSATNEDDSGEESNPNTSL